MKAAYKDLGYSKVDLMREKVKGHPEVVFCIGKTAKQVTGIMEVLHATGQNVLATKANRKIYSAVRKALPKAKYHSEAQLITLHNGKPVKPKGRILVISAGTADIPIAEEAAITAEFMGNRVERLYDVGVAGLHRLLSHTKKIRSADVLIVVAGMEGALPSVVSGLTSKPVIAVPRSVGYGAHFKGITTLLAMLNSCSPGVAVMNIDNGFGAGYFAAIINRE